MFSGAGHWVCSFWSLFRGNAGVGQYQILPVTGPELPVFSYKAIHSLWVPLLGLSVYRKDQTVYQVRLLLALVLGPGQRKSQGTLSLLLPTGCLLGSALEEPLAVLNLYEVDC